MLWCLGIVRSCCYFGGGESGQDQDKIQDQEKSQDRKEAECCLLPTQKRGRFLLGSFGALFVALSSVVYFLDPVELITKTALHISEGSIAYKMWKRPPLPITVKIFIFNYTNTDAFLRGDENLKVEQLGPYVFSEHLENQNVTFNKNNTISYIPRRTVAEVPEQTVGSTKHDVITVPNLPYLAVASYLADASIFPNLAFNAVAAMLKSEPFLTMTVEEYLWGYSDPMVGYAHKLLPHMFTFDKFGYMDRVFDDGDNVITMNLNTEPKVLASGREMAPLTIDHFNGEAGLMHYGYRQEDPTTHRRCNTLQGVAATGQIFPRHVSKNATYLLYRKVFCRTMPIVFNHTGVTRQGVPGYWFKFPDDAFDNTNPENSCYCRPEEKRCFPNGLSEMTSCYWNMPAAVSFPHFLNVNSSQFKTVEGLSPNEEDHGSSIVIQQNIGVMMAAHSRIQVNLIMGDVKYNLNVKPFSNMVIPLLWTDFCFDEVPPSVLTMIYLLVVVAPIAQNTLIIFFGVVGVVLLFASLARSFCAKRREKQNQLWMSGYSQVKIVPIVRQNLVL